MPIHIKKISLLFLILLVSEGILASNSNVVTSRYLSVVDKPLPEQQDLLSQIFQVHFPIDIQTIGDAMHYLLRFSGYSLINEANQGIALKNTLKKPLPLVDRNFGPMSLKDGLSTLAGPAFTLMHDPLNREVNFKLKTTATWHKG